MPEKPLAKARQSPYLKEAGPRVLVTPQPLGPVPRITGNPVSSPCESGRLSQGRSYFIN
nr:MAG TPA: hypothetical protein [Caudoviricetes sp.]